MMLLAETLSQAAYANWIEPTVQVGQENTTIRVWLPDDVTRDWLENDYAECIEEALVRLGAFEIEYTRDRDTFSEGAVRLAGVVLN